MNSIKDIWNLSRKELNKQFTKNYLRLNLAGKSKNNFNEIDKYILEKFEENQSSLTSDDLYELYLDQNKIEKIEKNTFNGLSSLQSLSLSENEIEKIEENAFNGLSTLKELKLSFNKIKVIEDNTFNGLSSLKELYLSKNKIENHIINPIPGQLKIFYY